MEKDKYYYCRDCHCNIELELKNVHTMTTVITLVTKSML